MRKGKQSLYEQFGGTAGGYAYPGAFDGPPMPGFNPFGTQNQPIVNPMMGFGQQPTMGLALQQLLTQSGPPQNAGGFPSTGTQRQGLGDRIVGGIGGAIGGIGNWLTDPEQGLNRTYLASQALGALSDIYGARQENKRYEEDRERAEREREEQKANYESWDPMRQEIMARYLGRL